MSSFGWPSAASVGATATMEWPAGALEKVRATTDKQQHEGQAQKEIWVWLSLDTEQASTGTEIQSYFLFIWIYSSILFFMYVQYALYKHHFSGML
jgi:hypothetical protein